MNDRFQLEADRPYSIRFHSFLVTTYRWANTEENAESYAIDTTVKT